MTRECPAIVELLEAFVDGELAGADRLRVAQHLDGCSMCAHEAAGLREVGEALRERAAPEVPLHHLAGLASSVVSRTRAEKAMSWQSRLARASEDWHWAIVGAGSCAATLVSTLFVSAILTFGPAPVREDSLKTLLSSDGVQLALAAPVELAEDIVLLDYDGGASARPFLSRRGARPQTESDLVGDLAATVTRQGRVLTLSGMDPADRLRAEALLDEITRLRLAEPQMVGRPVSSHVVVASAISWRSARGLAP